MAEFPGDHPALGGIRLVLGGNVFGWTIDRDKSFAVLDAYYEAGGRMVDTAEGYSNWVPGNKGGESEAIIGEWMESRGVRRDMRIATKTGQGGAPGLLKPDVVRRALEGSLERLRTDYVDLYYAHRDDQSVPIDEVVGVYDKVYRAGKAHELAASNYTPDRLAEALNTADRMSARGFTVIQPLYNLIARYQYEGALQALCLARGIAVTPYYALASGFLTGKFRSAEEWRGSSRAGALDRAAQTGGWSVLAAMDKIAARTGLPLAGIALAWLNTRPGVAAPIASATAPEQVREIAAVSAITLDDAALAGLESALAG